MPLCYQSPQASMLGNRTAGLLLRPALLSPFLLNPIVLRASVRFRCVLDHMAPRLGVCSSLLGAGNVIAASAAAGTGAAHGAVTSTIAHVAVTAVAIASGACLSTKVDFLWPRGEELPASLVFDGVDVTGCPIFNDAKVQKAIEFAQKAHQGQFRKTGEPYVTHCVHTGKILAAMVPSSGIRAINTIVAGILHDVVDDTFESLHSIEEEFGEDVAHLVAGVSKLSYINQLLRRHRRKSVNQNALSPEEANKLRVMLLGMVDDPRVVLVKLADRLHNMRTIYALPLPKAQAVAEETLAVWCSLASRLGVWALKAELEDLCFAVIEPVKFQQMRAELASMWSSSNKTRNLRRTNTKAGFVVPLSGDANMFPNHTNPEKIIEDARSLKEILQAVLPFDLLVDQRKRTTFLTSFENLNKSKVACDAGAALASLMVCEEALERELFISTSYIPGMEVTVSSRLKSLYGIYCKMKRKDVEIAQVYDARALRVVVGDRSGKLHGPAVRSCYSLLNIVHRLWSPIDGEFDDYIINPKPSGYQSLHTAVQGPDNSPLEVQIRTQRMHECAEFGLAAHWLYKETANNVRKDGGLNDTKINAPSYESQYLDDEASVPGDACKKYSSLKSGHPVLRVEGSQLLAAVIIRVDHGGRELLVAVSFELEASETLADRRYSRHDGRWEAYARLYKKVSDQWWFAPGHGDLSTCLEKYTLCRDGIYHKQDQFQRLLPTFIQVIELTDPEEAEYWTIVSAVLEGKQIVPTTNSNHFDKNNLDSSNFSAAPSINNKVHLLRTMLQWEEQVKHEKSPLRETDRWGKSCSVPLGEIVVICWPHVDIMRLRSGSTAADAARRIGLEGKLVWLNGHLVLPQTELKDGDIVEVRL